MKTKDEDVRKAREVGNQLVSAISIALAAFKGEKGNQPEAPQYLAELAEYAWYGVGDPESIFGLLHDSDLYAEFLKTNLNVPGEDTTLDSEQIEYGTNILLAASARHAIDTQSFVNTEQLAALARVTERTIRTATSSSNPNAIPIEKNGHWTNIDGEDALKWLLARTDFIPTALEDTAPNVPQLISSPHPGIAWKSWRVAQQKSVKDVADALHWSDEDRKRYTQIEEGQITLDCLHLEPVFWFELSQYLGSEDQFEIASESQKALERTVFNKGWEALERRRETQKSGHVSNEKESGPMKMYAVVERGKAIGTELAPHRHSDGKYVVSMTRFEKDYIRVETESELTDWVARGYKVRMSNQDVKNHKSPSLISPGSIRYRALES